MWLESLVLREESFCRRKTWVSAECSVSAGYIRGALDHVLSNVVVVTIINLAISVLDPVSSKALFDPILFCTVNYAVHFNYFTVVT